MVELAHIAPALDGLAAQRADDALSARKTPSAFDPVEGVARLNAVFEQAGLELEA